MKATVWVAPIASVAILFGTIGVAQASGGWVTSGKQAVVAGQQLTVDDLKGWMSLQQAADGVRMPLDELLALIAPPAGVQLTGATLFKEVEGLVPGFELTAFREALRAHLAGQPVAPGELPTPAASVTPPPGPAAASPSVTGQQTLREVAAANGLDPVVLTREAGLPEGTGLDVPLKELREANPGFEIQAVRDALERLA